MKATGVANAPTGGVEVVDIAQPNANLVPQKYAQTQYCSLASVGKVEGLDSVYRPGIGWLQC